MILNTKKKIWIFGILGFIYLVGQGLGIFLTTQFFLWEKADDYIPQVQSISLAVSKGEFSLSQRKDAIIKLYDLDGREIPIPDHSKDFKKVIPESGIREDLTPLIHEIQSGKTVARIRQVGKLPSQSLLIGVPFVQEGKIKGALFLLKPASEYRSALLGFSLVYIVTLIVGTFAGFYFIRNYLKELAGLEQTRKRYIANVSHELRTPLSSVCALSETLMDGMVSEEPDKQRYYQIIYRESKRLEALITEMLEMAKLQGGKTVFPLKPVEGAKMIQQISESFSIKAKERHISLVVSEAAKHSPTLYTCEARIVQVFNILLDNALKFTPEGGTIHIDCQEFQKHITFQVIDQGPGIPKAILPYVFDRFFSESPGDGEASSGLGLSIAQEILSQLGETIDVSNNATQGTTFRFSVHRG